MLEYSRKAMILLINHDKKLADYFLELAGGSHDLGEAARIEIFRTLVHTDVDLERRYKEFAGIEQDKVIETPLTRLIDSFVANCGWKSFVEGLTQYARNKKIQMRSFGIEEKHWGKIEDVLSGLPKQPQL